MNVTEVTPDYSVSPQIAPEDVTAIKAMGFKSIMCNRPDGEDPGQPAVADIQAEAERQGLAFAFVPVVSSALTPETTEAFGAAIEDLPKPILAYCRSGTRCRNMWALVR